MKQKKMIALLLSVAMTASLLLLSACGNKPTTDEENRFENWSQLEEDHNGTRQTKEENADDSTSESASKHASDNSENVENSASADDAEWREFLKDYEDWVDSYIEIIEKYNANPMDMSLLSDYTEMMTELADWTERADEIEVELEDSDAALEYSAELARIAAKLAEAAY